MLQEKRATGLEFFSQPLLFRLRKPQSRPLRKIKAFSGKWHPGTEPQLSDRALEILLFLAAKGLDTNNTNT
jgi:hypothetical protein